MEFSQILNKLMLEKDVTSYRVGKDADISNRLIDYWKKGEKMPGAENLKKLADYFHVSIDYLLGNTPYPTLKEEIDATRNLDALRQMDTIHSLHPYENREISQHSENSMFYKPVKGVFKNRLQDAISAQNLTLEEVSNSTGVSLTRLNHFIDGSNLQITPMEISALASLLRISPENLLGVTADDSRTADPEIRRIERARQNMPPKVRANMMKVFECYFSEYFDESFEDTDTDE